ncbi:MAG TPA: alpha/beta hydrolase, partial [Bryobacteraceae bacterium]|nr:alpha/beta hydrolase [Bryobacteraceae bacterium]
MRRLLPLLVLAACAARAEVRHIKTSDGVDLFVTVRGHGTPCLYLHGGPGSGSHWLEKFSGEMLERNFQMIYLDQRGTSRSTSPPNGDYSMDRMVRDFEEVRVALGIRQWLTLGHSFGGILQVGYAQRHPEVVQGLLMINCGLNINAIAAEVLPHACSMLGAVPPRPCTDESARLIERVSAVFGLLRDRDLFWKLGYASLDKKKLMDATFDDLPDWNKDFESKALGVKEYWQDYAQFTPFISAPVLFFYGRSDWMVGPTHYKHARFPHMLLWP